MYVENRNKKTALALVSEAVFPDYQPHMKGTECMTSLQPNGQYVNTGTGEFQANFMYDCTTILQIVQSGTVAL